jgi:membrane protein
MATTPTAPVQQRVWDYVSRSPLHSLWNLEGVPLRVVMRRTWRSLLADNLLGRAAELGFFFLFALFPTLFSASSILGMAAQSASSIYYKLLEYLALVVPTSALGMVLTTFSETTAHASSGKLTFGLIAAIWSASVGVSAIQEALNTVYNVRDTRSYFKARLSAIGITILLVVLATLTLTALLGGDFVAAIIHARITNYFAAALLALASRIVFWGVATALLTLCFAVIYFWAPGVRKRRWRWLTPGGAVGILAWVLVSLGFRLYLHYFNFYSITYGSLGAVIILLMWFYITGFMLLLGAEINSEIEAAAVERSLWGLTATGPIEEIATLPAAPPSSSPPTPHTSGDPSGAPTETKEGPSDPPV